MRVAALRTIRVLVNQGRAAFRRACPRLALRLRRAVPGQFQPYTHTEPNRYPWIFEFARSQCGRGGPLRILSFGCSRGDEVFALRAYFPDAAIKGIDIDPENIAVCLSRARAQKANGLTFAVASTTGGETTEAYDAIFCLAVLCLGDLTVLGMERSDPFLRFADFEQVVTDLARCLKPGGLLLLHTTNFRFGDTAIADRFDVVLHADPSQLAPDVTFGRDNRVLNGDRYTAVGFRKRPA